MSFSYFFFNDTATTEIYTLSRHYALPILLQDLARVGGRADRVLDAPTSEAWIDPWAAHLETLGVELRLGEPVEALLLDGDRKSTSLNSSHANNSYVVFCLKKKRELSLDSH